MIKVKVLAEYITIMLLSFIRACIFRLLFGGNTKSETDRHFELIMAILFAALIIREGLW